VKVCSATVTKWPRWQRLWELFRLAANRRPLWHVTPWTKYAIPAMTIMMTVMNYVWRESQLEITVVKIVGYTSLRHGSFTDRRRSWLQQTRTWPDACKLGEMNALGFGSRQVKGETSIVSNITLVVVTDAVHATWWSLDAGRQICTVCNWIHRVTAIKDHNSSTCRATDWDLTNRSQIQGSPILDLTLSKYI
jgi:hypothetical protein